MPDEIIDETQVCYYFLKTAACRYFERCTKSHPRPTLSTAILIPNFFSHFKLEKAIRDEYDSDIGLEYEDTELHNEFLDFYEDVVPELRKSGTLIQFKVCCNLEPHLRGNVYVQYQTIREAIEAFRKFNGRFYNGRQLSLQFIRIDSWRSAICGSFLRKACVKGRTCNYLHVFRNPTKEFVQADHDWKEYQRPGTSYSTTPSAQSVSFTPTTANLQITPKPPNEVGGTERSKDKTDSANDGLKSLTAVSVHANQSSSGNAKREVPLLSSSHSLSHSKSLSNERNHPPDVKVRTKQKRQKSDKKKRKHKEKHGTSSPSLSSSSSLSPKKKRKKLKSKKKKTKKSKKRKKETHEKEKDNLYE